MNSLILGSIRKSVISFSGNWQLAVSIFGLNIFICQLILDLPKILTTTKYQIFESMQMIARMKILRYHSQYFSASKSSSTVQYSYPPILKQPNNKFRLRVCFQFANLPLNSKYYHTELPKTIQPALILAKKQEKLNEKCHLLENAAEIILKDPKAYTNSVKQAFVLELKKWEGTSGRFTKIATVAWIIRKLSLEDKLMPLYEDIVRRVDEDEWYVNFDESVKAIESFTDYRDEEVRNRIYEKIERNVGLTLSDVNMVYYQRITLGLLQAGRHESELWTKVEELVLRNLSMEYTPKVFFDIFKAFAISRNGSDSFYQISQQIIFKGHLYSRSHLLRSNLGDYDSTGQFFALIAETYAIVHRFTPIPVDPDFMDYMYKSMRTPRLEYKQIDSLTKLLRHLPEMGFHSDQVDDVVGDIIENKKFESYASLEEIQQLFHELQLKYKRIPAKIVKQIEGLVIKDINRKSLPLSKAIQLVSYLSNYSTSEHKPLQINPQLFQDLEKYLQKRHKYLSPDQSKEVKLALQLFQDNKSSHKLGFPSQFVMITQKK